MLLALPFPEISPTLFEFTLGGFTLAIRWYALAYIFGIILGVWIAGRAIARDHLWANEAPPMNKQELDDFVTWLILGIILGGRLGYVLFYEPEHFAQNPGDILKVWNGGMAFHGGFLGVTIAALVFLWRRNLPVGGMADLLALCAPPGLLFGRLANFINAELWGRPSDVPWAVIFPTESAQDCPGVEGLCARHPSQLYEAGLEGILLGVILLWLAFARGWLKMPGAICGLFLVGYGAARFFVEFYRVADEQFITEDNPLGRVFFLGEFGLSMGQLLSLPMVLVGALILVMAFRRS